MATKEDSNIKTIASAKETAEKVYGYIAEKAAKSQKQQDIDASFAAYNLLMYVESLIEVTQTIEGGKKDAGL